MLLAPGSLHSVVRQTWKLNELERPEWSRELPRLELGKSHLPSHAASNPTPLWTEGLVPGLE
jgi:hypothetical protein